LDDKALIKIYRDKISQLKKRLMEVKEKEEQIQKLQTAELEKKSLEESNVILLERHVSLLLRRLVYYPPTQL
jgi:ABC-type Zn uptake system ZnuABC Zn-binding protein ZnuA